MRNWNKIKGQVRHILSALGGLAVAFGYASDDMVADSVDAIMKAAGAIAVVISMVWSWLDPAKRIGEGDP